MRPEHRAPGARPSAGDRPGLSPVVLILNRHMGWQNRAKSLPGGSPKFNQASFRWGELFSAAANRSHSRMTRRGTNKFPPSEGSLVELGGHCAPNPLGFSAILPSHVAIQNQNTTGDKPCLSPYGLAPEVGAQVASLRCLTLRSGPQQSKPGEQQQKMKSYAFKKRLPKIPAVEV